MNRPTSRKYGKHASLTTHIFSLAPGLAIPALFTWMYSSTLDFAPLWVWLVTLNLTLMGLMGKDKLAATRQWPRTPELTLLLLTFLGATPAIFAGRYVFHHKTSKQSFTYSLYAVIVLQVAAAWYFWPTLQQYL